MAEGGVGIIKDLSHLRHKITSVIKNHISRNMFVYNLASLACFQVPVSGCPECPKIDGGWGLPQNQTPDVPQTPLGKLTALYQTLQLDLREGPGRGTGKRKR